MIIKKAQWRSKNKMGWACMRCAKCSGQLEFHYHGKCYYCGTIIDAKMWQKYLTKLCRKAINALIENKQKRRKK